jgi:hypothetical protein
MRRVLTIAVLVAMSTACSGGETGGAGTPDAGQGNIGVNAGPDAGRDAGPGADAGTDAGTDAGADGGHDAGPDAGTADAGGATDGGMQGGDWLLPLRHSPIYDENQLQGSSGWQLTAYSPQLGAYCDQTSYLPGQQATLYVGAPSAATANWQLWRVGYYGGAGGRLYASGGPFPVQVASAPVLDANTGAVHAAWLPSFKLPIPATAVTGVYLVKISAPGAETYATFVVRDPQRTATILYTVSTNTYQAYNPWGGTSLYENHRSDWHGGSHAFAVSFDRPYQRGSGAGELFEKDADFITFSEGQGYDIAYESDHDLDADASLADHRRMIAVQGHSEYWTAGMRDAVEGAIAHGTSVAFFAANNAYWQVRFQDAARRTLLGYKDRADLDPAMQTDPVHVTTKWRLPPVNRPENAIIGEMFGTWITTDAPLYVTDASSWIWAGTGVHNNSMIAGAYGDEVDTRLDNGLQPSGVSVIASGSVEGYNGALAATGETTIFTAPSGAQVFSAGSITFSQALASPGSWDPRVQQLVGNIFSRFGGDGTLPAPLLPLNLPPGAQSPHYRPGVQAATLTRALVRPAAVAAAPNGDAIVADGDRIVRVTRAGVVSTIAGGDPGYVDGVGGRAQFSGPHGVAVAPNGDIYVSDTGNHVIRVISGGVTRTLAGTGTQGFADGVGPSAMFSQPMGIALTPSGTLLVADMWNHRLRAVSPTGDVTTWAGNGASDVQDGPGTQAQLSFPFAVTVLASGDAAIAEPGTGLIRTVSASPSHAVTELLGAVGSSGWADGPAASASVSETLALAALPDGQLLFIDGASARVRALRGSSVDTLAGGNSGGTQDGQGSGCGFGWPRALAASPDGTVLVVDIREHTLRLLTLN